ncbi:MAG: AEC family transporter [Clostridia bacterium]|nr:AEC family transporter [Clostridia bacterium]
MESLLFALGAVAPIMLTVALGYGLRRVGLMSADFAKAANKLVFRVFLPATLFCNVYGIEALADIDLTYMIYALLVVFGIFALMLPLSLLATEHKSRRGPLVQVAFRSNFALVGLALAGSLFGQEGELIATLLSAVVIPLFNVLAVISLSVFGEGGERARVRRIVLDILKNPLIISIALGFVALGVRALLVQNGIAWRLSDVTPVFDVLGYLSDLATPMALLVLGARFEFSAIKALRREIVIGTLARCLAAPLLGVGIAFVFFRDSFNGAHFAAFVALFASPVAISSAPMTQELGGDVELAGQLVVWTTLVSALSIFLCSFLLRLAGVFG